MANYAIYIKTNKVEVSFTGVTGDDVRSQVALAILNLAQAHGPVTLAANDVNAADEFTVTYSISLDATVTREGLRNLSDQIGRIAYGLSEAGA